MGQKSGKSVQKSQNKHQKAYDLLRESIRSVLQPAQRIHFWQVKGPWYIWQCWNNLRIPISSLFVSWNYFPVNLPRQTSSSSASCHVWDSPSCHHKNANLCIIRSWSPWQISPEMTPPKIFSPVIKDLKTAKVEPCGGVLHKKISSITSRLWFPPPRKGATAPQANSNELALFLENTMLRQGWPGVN